MMSIITSKKLPSREFAYHFCGQRGGMVSSAHPQATEAGVLMLELGGSAVDAAVATAFALCVCEPQACGVGGQSYALLHIGGRITSLDGSGKIPALLDKTVMTEDDVSIGYRATSVPTTPAVLASMHSRYGRLPWRTILEPAIKLAAKGYIISQLQHDLQKRELAGFMALPCKSGAHYFLGKDMVPHSAGDNFIQLELASLLERMAKKGVKDFYLGKTAQLIEADMLEHGGFLRLSDLKHIPWPLERKAIRNKVFGKEIYSTPPPTQGRLLLYTLAVSEVLTEKGIDPTALDAMEYMADLFYAAYKERIDHPCEPELYDFATDILFSRATILKTVDNLLAGTFSPGKLPGMQGGETTHLSVMDRKGNSVGITQSVNMVYGSKTAAKGLGFLYNNYLLDSYQLPDDHPHALVPGRCAPSSVAPFIIMEDGKPWLLGGSPGSQRIVSTLTLFILHVLIGNKSLDQAVRLPRFHSQRLKKIELEENAFSEQLLAKLASDGYLVEERPSFYFGAVHGVLRNRNGVDFQGIAECRRDGVAGAPASIFSDDQ